MRVAALDLLLPDPSWYADAACRNVGWDVFFPDTEAGFGAARAWCIGCPVRETCFEAGMREQYGMWGGATPTERRQELRRRQQRSA